MKDYRRALDFVFERGLVDTNGVGLVPNHYVDALGRNETLWPCHFKMIQQDAA